MYARGHVWVNLYTYTFNELKLQLPDTILSGGNLIHLALIGAEK